MLKRKQVLLAKVETTYGTDSTPTAGDNAILALNPEIKTITEPIERDIHISTLSQEAAQEGLKYCEVTFQVEIKGSGSAGTAPRLGALLKACSTDETVVSGTSVTYQPVSSNQDSATLYLYIDGRRHIVTGAKGRVKITATANQIGLLDFTFQGIWNAPTATAIVSGTYDSTTPQPCKDCSFSYNSKTTLVAKMVEIDLANEIIMRENLNATTGIEGFEVTKRKPMMTFDVEAQIWTSYDFRGDRFTNQREVSFQIGSSAGNICTVTVPKYNITGIEYADADGILIEKLTGECVKDTTGDDELTIVFT
jgi:hypothetical protein